MIQDKRFDYLRLSGRSVAFVEEDLLSKFERMYLEKLGVKLAAGELKPEKPNPQFDLIHGFFQQARQGLAEYQADFYSGLKRSRSSIWNGWHNEGLWPSTQAGRSCRACESCTSSYESKDRQVSRYSLQGTFRAVLMSPHFFLSHSRGARGGRGHLSALAGDELARRLNYLPLVILAG